MRILFFGDINGSAGRKALKKHLPLVKNTLSPDVIITNGENAAHGFGLTQKICDELFSMGVDVITTGNHVWDHPEVIPAMTQNPNILRPLNFTFGSPGRGYVELTLNDGRRIAILNAMGSLFMDAHNLPFPQIDMLLDQMPLGKRVNAIFLDFHAETTSEKMALGYHLDGRVTAVIGTHTHVPTADARILQKGTAYMSDAGMCGDYDSVIGMEKEAPIKRFLKATERARLSPAEKEGTIAGVYIESDDQTGKALTIHPVIVGPHLINTLPTI